MSEIKFKSTKKEHGADAHFEFQLMDGGIQLKISRGGTSHHGDFGDSTRAWFTVSEVKDIVAALTKQLQELE